MLSHISYSLYWRMEMGNDTVMLKTAPVAAVPRTARQSLTKPKSAGICSQEPAEMLRGKQARSSLAKARKAKPSRAARELNFKATLTLL